MEPIQPQLPAPITPDARRAMIEEAAYYRAERRGFAPGGEVEDWVAAAQDIEQLHPVDGPSMID